MGVNMDNSKDINKEVFEYLLAADQNIWSAIQKIMDSNDEKLKEQAKPLMLLRGEIHTEFMRPIYKEYPELAEKAGF